MATTAAIVMSAATIKSGQLSTATCTLTNGGATAVNVLWMKPKVCPTGETQQSVSAAVGIPPIGGPWVTEVAGSNGTLAISFSVTAFAPFSSYDVAAQQSQYVYDVGATIGMSDGSIVEATPATLTVDYPAT